MRLSAPKELFFVSSSRKDLQSFPGDVQDEVGFALHQAQTGLTSRLAKPLKGFGGAGVLEIIDNYQTDTYRAVYTVKLHNAVYVLHCFQKKSKSGHAMTQQDKQLIQSRLRDAEADHEARSHSS